MKAKVALLVVMLFLVGSMPVASSSQETRAIAIGKLTWTRASTCEPPDYPGMFLQYYLTDGCQRTLFLFGNLRRDMVGSTIWADFSAVPVGFPNWKVVAVTCDLPARTRVENTA